MTEDNIIDIVGLGFYLIFLLFKLLCTVIYDERNNFKIIKGN